MEPLDDLESVEARLKREYADLRSRFRRLTKPAPDDLDQVELALSGFRHRDYESVNQILHELLLVDAMHWLRENTLLPDGWQAFWNPGQTGGKNEPDIEIRDSKGGVVVSAEATASHRPIGTIESRMARTLAKLSAIPGSRFYFVRTKAMGQRDRTKTDRNGYLVNVVELPRLGQHSRS